MWTAAWGTLEPVVTMDPDLAWERMVHDPATLRSARAVVR
jgi:hypothetical protein